MIMDSESLSIAMLVNAVDVLRERSVLQLADGEPYIDDDGMLCVHRSVQ